MSRDENSQHTKGEKVEVRSREINVLDFVKSRMKQIAELLEAVDNAELVVGEVTKGPRTALQRLPRHMRRRAMSYNVKRLPRSQRRFALAVTKASKHRKKAPSRFWRRRPCNLLREYIRRQRKNVWLETHIWHAKRFRMIEKYGYKLAVQSFQRSFRPSYRDSVRHCAVQDISFLNCFQITVEDRQWLISTLSVLFPPSASPTLAYKTSLNGTFEISSLLYEPGEYPRGFIGPVRFMWCKKKYLFSNIYCSDTSYSLLVWSHPSTSGSILKHFTELLNLSRSGNSTSDENSSAKFVSRWNSRTCFSYKDALYIADSGKCSVITDEEISLHPRLVITQLLDLREQFVRIRMYGPKSMAVLEEVLHVVDETDIGSEWMNAFRHLFFCLFYGDFGEFPNGLVLYLLVSDPRVSRPARKCKPTEKRGVRRFPFDLEALPGSVIDFWDAEKRKSVYTLQHLNYNCVMEPAYGNYPTANITDLCDRFKKTTYPVLESRISVEELQKRRSNNLATGSISSCKIPILLVTRNMGSGTTKTSTGVDLVVPAGFGLDFWLALQYGTARAVGLRDQKFFGFESGLFHFPSDVPDCDSGIKEMKEDHRQLSHKYLSRPYNRRVQFRSTLFVKYPFSFAWPVLVRDWNENEISKTSNSKSVYVLRDRKCLDAVDKWIRGKAAVLDAHSCSLVPVQVEAKKRGRPLRYCLICIPTEDDLYLWDIPSNAISENTEGCKRAQNPEETNNPFKAMSSEADGEKGFIELSGNEKLVSLNEMFPDKEILKIRKKNALKRRRRQRAKLAKRQKFENQELSTKDGEETSREIRVATSTSAVEKSYRESCSRSIIGRIVRGEYSFSSAKGRGIGYCSLLSLKNVRNGKVLFRNTTSKYYHFGKLSILSEPVIL
ncbi:unnamed protein product [Enterobius vermicularis]|uniref:Ribonucleases P/MRP protein subunit POP1 n=1 Tax=Enterobius vermicularis TaxID=51028 RepID=A0A0N4VH07_ENTVE|nr:unnamed protein product [Enterobius vermicularis]